MKRILPITYCLILSAMSLRAQEVPKVSRPAFTGGELIIGQGFLPTDQLFSDMEFMIGANAVRRATGALFLTYRYHFSRKWSLGITTAFERESGTWTSSAMISSANIIVDPGANYKYTRTTYTIAPELTFKYFSTDNGLLDLYGSIGAGYTYSDVREVITNEHATYRKNMERSPLHFNAYLAPIGLRFGHALSGFIEGGIGYKGVLTYGLSYRF